MQGSVLQGTVAKFNEDGSGEAVLDAAAEAGRRIAFGAAAFAVSGLGFLRPGQRVRLDVVGNGSISAVHILTMHP